MKSLLFQKNRIKFAKINYLLNIGYERNFIFTFNINGCFVPEQLFWKQNMSLFSEYRQGRPCSFERAL